KSANQNHSLNPEVVKQTSQAITAFMKISLDAMDPKWFRHENEDSANDGLNRITAEIKPADWGKFVASATAGLLQTQANATADQPFRGQLPLKDWAELLKGSELQQPAVLKLAIDEEGFVRKENVFLALNLPPKDGKTRSMMLDLALQTDDINQNPAFTMEIPTNTKPFADVLRLLNQ
ncbi:MAG TPA: hypothetical protein VF260_07225, partial [Bacilli bacterium]